MQYLEIIFAMNKMLEDVNYIKLKELSLHIRQTK